ncbi:hypothetical protein SAMN04515671_0587 [Nakamurella panacisegetis]|uniref:Mannosylglycerate hydrolase MGH1-like glycoside hydrolase domain-containing protein n=1 Tax=Nakamurella panacisegetis TaxID=1090615 RepID=A0A1H0IP18_9ACTN|nr:glucosidase [Nakamurella panacisegetis]SDO33123.1 hypothetical protein SAMN04515671_0587 [Nakamurella panacisegetis]
MSTQGRHARSTDQAAHRSAEHARLAESPSASGPWRLWGPYLSGRQWGTVREDYSADGDAWAYLPFEQARARAYRWGEDGLGGISDRYGFLNLSVALWNGQDPILKERLFGLANAEGNHGEDVKEYWWVLDGTPTHSWMSWLYRYPQAEYPYQRLREENARRGRDDREFELGDTGILDQNRFFDVRVDYAKAGPDDICAEITVTNHGPDPAPLDVLPQIWFRNTWAWGVDSRTPSLHTIDPMMFGGRSRAVECTHEFLGRYVLAAEGAPEVLVCQNETNDVALFGSESNPTPYTKDGIDNRVVHGDLTAVNPDGHGTKAAFWYHFDAIAPGASVTIRLRLSTEDVNADTFGEAFTAVVADRRAEADDFYGSVIPQELPAADVIIARRAFAGLLWGKQLYRFDVRRWLQGDPGEPVPPRERNGPQGRNITWEHLSLADVISMPDEWEYPWFASWDLAFQCVALAHVDPAFAKDQLLLLCREWAMHPNGQLPAYEWNFSDVNPPVHSWAAWQVFLVDGGNDHDFLIRICTKLLLNFSWWVNTKDADGSNLFEGGFLGMDNIGFFDRSAKLPAGYRLEESDATSWMAVFCLNMLQMSLELAMTVPAWDDIATKFLEHFLSISKATRSSGGTDNALWDEQDGFYYDILVHPDGGHQKLRVRSMVGLLPVLAVATVAPEVWSKLPDFTARLAWLRRRRPDLAEGVVTDHGAGHGVMFALVDQDSLIRLAGRMLNESEFLSPFGIRALSAAYRTPFSAEIEGQQMTIDYEPGESRSGLFGGNSNWRGPIWFPVNVLLADALRRHAGYFGDTVTTAMPAPNGPQVRFDEAADVIDDRLVDLFRRGPDGRRPSNGNRIEASADPLWADHITFSEYFNGDTGEGLGASHQTGWTALVAHLLCRPKVSRGESTVNR